VYLCLYGRSHSSEKRLLASSCPHVSMWLQLDGLQVNFAIGDTTKICRGSPILVKIGQKYIWALYTRRAKDILLFRGHRFATKALLCNSQYLYIVEADTQHFVCIATVVTRIHQSVTLTCTLPNTSRSKPPMACHVPAQYYLQDTEPPFDTLTVVQIIDKYPALKG